VLNAILLKLMENFPMFAFMAMLSAIGEFQNYAQINEKWIRTALKCFEPCGNLVCEIGNVPDVVNAVVIVDRFFHVHSPDELAKSASGQKVLTGLRTFLHLVGQRYSDEIRKKEHLSRLSPNSPVLQSL
jgi:cytochrome c oxidase assembly factor CtaG